MARSDTIDHDYVALLQTLIALGEGLKGLPVGRDEWVEDAQGLLLKLIYHATSIYYLARGTRVAEVKTDFLDPASIQVLTRAVLETALTFSHIFAAPETDEERHFRHAVWRHAGLLTRRQFPTSTKFGRRQREYDQQVMDQLKEYISDHHGFRRFTCKQQRAILEKGKWRIRFSGDEKQKWICHWADLAREAGLIELIAGASYDYLSSYAHADYLSVMQLRDAVDQADRFMLVEGAFLIVKPVMALMVERFISVFPSVQPILDDSAEYTQAVERWLCIGKQPTGD